jgi:hypothetical protein
MGNKFETPAPPELTREKKDEIIDACINSKDSENKYLHRGEINNGANVVYTNMISLSSGELVMLLVEIPVTDPIFIDGSFPDKVFIGDVRRYGIEASVGQRVGF